ncbi:MAG: hypothetical protein V3V99_13815 [candidate division Zixibacteria bacterium]
MNKYTHEVFLGLIIIVIVGPLLIFQSPPYFHTPDIQYVKAKTLAVMSGNLYDDPVTGFPSFHPPYYHLFLSWLASIGISLEIIPLIMAMINVCLLLIFSYLMLCRIFDKTTALLTTAMIPYINQYMGPGNIFLATAFYFSLPIFIAGLWVYLREKQTVLTRALTGFLLGLSFIISPVYLFVVGFLFIYEIIWKRQWSQIVILIGVFLISIIPFLIHTYTISSYQMAGTSAFSFWRGWPDWEWFQTFIGYLLYPADGKISHWQVLITLAIFVIGIIGIRKSRSTHFLIYIFLTAYLFTSYHYNAYQYGPRIFFFFGLLVTGYLIRHLRDFINIKMVSLGIITAFILFGIGEHLYRSYINLENEKVNYLNYRQIGRGLKDNLPDFVAVNDYILASTLTYRNFIMPYFPVRALVAHHSGEYFQLNSRIADEMLRDYNDFMAAGKPELVDLICRKYNIKIAVIGGRDVNQNGFKTIMEHWEKVYEDQTFKIFRKYAASDEPTGSSNN